MPKLVILSPDDPHYLLAILSRLHQDRTRFADWHVVCTEMDVWEGHFTEGLDFADTEAYAKREWEGLGLD
jgi:hypothetical protein